MKVFAYCAQSFERSVRRAAGVEPLTCPPLSFQKFGVLQLSGKDFVYFKLHGLPAQPYWYGDGWLTALSEAQLRQADLRDSVVFVANCFLPESPMLDALLAAGAKAVIGGPGPNYASVAGIDGADLLGLWIRWGLQLGASVQEAFDIARVRLHLKPGLAAQDALGFQIWEGRKAA